MQRASHSYEKPSRISQALVVCFSVAVVFMAGWLALVILFPRDANTMAARDTDIEITDTPPYVENIAPEPEQLSVKARLNAAYFDPLPRDLPDVAPPPRSALPLGPVTEPPPAATFDSRYPTSLITAAAPNTNHRSVTADEFLQIAAAVEAIDVAPEVVPLPLPKPRRASVPVPRPRPRLDGEDQLGADPSFFDLLVSRQR